MISPVENWLAKKTGLDGRLTPDTLLHWQLERAWESVAYAKKNSPFYADHLSAVQCGTTLSDWRELPLMDASAVLPIRKRCSACLKEMWHGWSECFPRAQVNKSMCFSVKRIWMAQLTFLPMACRP